MYRVRLGLPHYQTSGMHLMPTAAYAASENGEVDVQMQKFGSSLLAKSFNVLWASALNAAVRGEVTHFCMMHDDITPESGWLDKLLGIMEARGDVLVSVVSPIKDSRGLTSCGLAYPGNRWEVRRFTLTECWTALPETFGQRETVEAGINDDDWTLVFNTGLWLADLRDPRWRETDAAGRARYYFTINDEVYLDDNGEFRTRTESEDWFFSRACAAGGLPYSVTRAVSLMHLGSIFYHNDQVFGQVRDERFFDHGPDADPSTLLEAEPCALSS